MDLSVPTPAPSATALLAELAAGRVSSVELVDQAIARIEAEDGLLNAVVVRDFDRARAAAVNADRQRAKGASPPLLGLPMTVKEQFNIQGLVTTWGHPAFRGWQPAEDALVVARLKAAGAIILGKSNVSFMLSDYQSSNEVFGTSRNPLDPSRSPGGSSGGGAAALAAGYVSLELGSDLGGSLRIPAHFCGVCSHKPSLNLIPLRGGQPPMLPARPYAGDALSGRWAVPGPMARVAADLALALEVLAGPDEQAEGKGYRLALPAARHQRLADFRVLLLDQHPLCPTAGGIRAALDALAERLGRAGCQVSRDSDRLPDLTATARVFAQLLSASLAADMPDQVFVQIRQTLAGLAADDDSLAALRLRAMACSNRELGAISGQARGILQGWRDLFDSVDVVLCPPAPVTAIAHDHRPFGQRLIDIDGQSWPYSELGIWAGPASLAGLPATTVPIGRDQRGLPVGVQIIGPFLEDHTCLSFARLIDAAAV